MRSPSQSDPDVRCQSHPVLGQDAGEAGAETKFPTSSSETRGTGRRLSNLELLGEEGS